MPRAPGPGERTVAPAALPSVVQTAAPTALSLGAGIANVGGDVTLALYSKEIREANQTAFMAADRQLAEAQVALHLKMQDLKGKDALGAPEFVEGDWQKAVNEIGKELTNDEQRRAFSRSALTRYEQLNKSTQLHVAEQKTIYQDQETDAYLKSSMDTARLHAAEPDAVNAERDRQFAVVNEWAERKGVYGTPVHDEKLMAVRSKTNTEVIQGLLFTGRDQQAVAWYQDHKDEFTAGDRDAIEKTLEEGSYRGDGQRHVRDWLQQGKDHKAMLAEVDTLEDPKLVTITRELVNQHFSDQATLEKEDHEQAYKDARERVDANPREIPRLTVPPAVWNKLTTDEQHVLDVRRLNATRPADRVNDDKAWLDFLEKTPEQVAALPRSAFDTLWAKLDHAHQGRAEAIWATARAAVEKKDHKDPNLTATLTFKDQVKNAWTLSGLVEADKSPTQWTAAQVKQYARFEQDAATALQRYEMTTLGGKRKASPDEVQTVIDQVKAQAIKKVFIERGVFGFKNEVRAIELADDERGRAFIPLDQIPKPELDFLKNYMTARNKKPTADKLRRAYAQHLLNNKAAFDAIVNE